MIMLPEVPPGQQRELANLVWDASQAVSGEPEQSLVGWIERWPHQATRSTVAAELLRCIAGTAPWTGVWLAQKLAEGAPYWNHPEQRLEAVRGLFADCVEVGRAAS